MKYQVNPYLIYELKKEQTTIIQTKESSFATKNSFLINFLNFLEENSIDLISYTDMKSIFNDEKSLQESIDFLVNNKIFSFYKERHLSNKKEILIFSNNTDFVNLATMFWENLKIKSLNELEEQCYDNRIIIICLNSFNLSELKKLAKKCKEHPSNIYKFIFPYNHSIYISNYYSEEWGNPCPLCFFYSIEAQLRGSQTGVDNLNFQVMVDLFYRESGNFEYDGLLDKEDWISVINELNKEFKLPETMSNKIDDVLKIDLSSYSLSYDTCYHWEMCDCYE